MLASDDAALIEQARFLSQQARDPEPHYEHSEIGYNYRMSNILAAIGRGQLNALDERVRRKREIFEYYRQALGGLPGIEFMPEAPYGWSNRWLTVVLITPQEFGADREDVRLALEAENIESRPVWKPMHLQPVFKCRIEDRGSRIEDQSERAEGRGVGRRAQGARRKVEGVRLEVGGGKEEKKEDVKIKKRYAARVVGGEVSEDLFRRGLCLPSGTAMTEEDLDRVVSAIRACRGGFRRRAGVGT